MKKTFYLIFILFLISCEKYIPYNCEKDNYGYLSITGKYEWYCLRITTDSFPNYKYIWLGNYETKYIRFSSGEYNIWNSKPYIKNDKELELMLSGSFAPIPADWITCGSIIINLCDTTVIN